MIQYTASFEGITAEELSGFFIGWPNPPLPETHLELLRQSDAVELAVDTDTGHIVGFATAITDGVLAAHLTFLEVLPDYQHRGIGTELVRRILARFTHLYGISVQCDAELQPFYKRFEMKPGPGMGIWRYHRQAGEEGS